MTETAVDSTSAGTTCLALAGYRRRPQDGVPTYVRRGALHAGLLAVLLLLCALATGCGTGQGQGTVAIHSKLPAPCRANQLRIRDTGLGGVAAGTLSENIEFRSDGSCVLRSGPSVRLLSRSGGRLLATRMARDTPMGPVVLLGRRPAYAELFYMNPDARPKACSLKAYYMAISATRDMRSVKVRFRDAPLRFCPGVIHTSGYGYAPPQKP